MYNKLTLVIPAKNEKESLPTVLDELKKYDLKKLIVLEPSDKETINAIKEYDCQLIYQSNKGYGDAIKLGIKNVKTDYFSIFNADGSFNPSELENMLELLESNQADVVFASRYEKGCGTQDDTIITFIGNFIFTKLGNIFFKLNVTDILYTYVIAKTDCIKKLDLKKNDFRLCVELPIKAKRAGINIKTSKSYERRRISGKKKVNAIRDGFYILLEMIRLFFVKN